MFVQTGYHRLTQLRAPSVAAGKIPLPAINTCHPSGGQIICPPPETARLYRKDATLSRFFHPLIIMLASMSRSELPKCITVMPRERQRLLELSKALRPAIKHLITIVSYQTFLRLASERSPRKAVKHGRPKTADEIILRLAVTTLHGALIALWRGFKTRLNPYAVRSTFQNRCGDANRTAVGVPDFDERYFSNILSEPG